MSRALAGVHVSPHLPPFLSSPSPRFHTLFICHVTAMSLVIISFCRYQRLQLLFCKARAGARSWEPGPRASAHDPAWRSPHLRTLSTLPGTPSSLQPSCLLGSPLGLLRGGRAASPPGSGALKVAWAPCCSSLGPAQPGLPAPHIFQSSRISAAEEQGGRGCDLICQASEPRGAPGLPTGRPAQLPAPSSHPGGVQWTTRRWRWDGHAFLRKG